MLVQKGTALDMLLAILGTDVLGELGFQVLQVENVGKRFDLLSPDRQEPKEEMQLPPMKPK